MNNIKKIIALFWRIRIKIQLIRKTRKIKDNIEMVKVPKDLKRENMKLWKPIDSWHSIEWLKIYSSINGIKDARYVSEQTYYSTIEPRLNNASFAEAYADKNFYSKIIDNYYLPKTLLRCIEGVFYDEDYNMVEFPEKTLNIIIKTQDKIVLKKAVETGGGRSVEILSKANMKRNEFSPSALTERFGKCFIIQEYIYQHDFFKQFNPSSVNTIRIFTYRSVVDNSVHILHAVLRIGKPGAIVDNQASGGISCGIEIETGLLHSFAIDKLGNKYFESNGIPFKGLAVPAFSKMKKMAAEIAFKYQYHRLLGFDISLTENGIIKLIEINNKNNEINFYQMNNGPLFGIFTNEIINFCKKNKTIINLDFKI